MVTQFEVCFLAAMNQQKNRQASIRLPHVIGGGDDPQIPRHVQPQVVDVDVFAVAPAFLRLSVDRSELGSVHPRWTSAHL
jgi:hypothetical protein